MSDKTSPEWTNSSQLSWPFLFEKINPEKLLLAQIAALREEIAALRADLRPASSLIMTGKEVVKVFHNLRKNK